MSDGVVVLALLVEFIPVSVSAVDIDASFEGIGVVTAELFMVSISLALSSVVPLPQLAIKSTAKERIVSFIVKGFAYNQYIIMPITK